MRRLDLHPDTRLPPGFAADGTKLREFDRDTGLTRDSEGWVVKELATPEGGRHDHV